LTKVVQVKVPEFLSERDVRIATAIEAYSKGSISVGKAAEIAEIPIQEFLVELKKKRHNGISIRRQRSSRGAQL
jgi:predicted HTH domain antitoxin